MDILTNTKKGVIEMSGIENKTQIVTLGLIGVVLLILSYCLFYIPPKEWAFMKDVEAKFNASDSSIVKVSEITDFDWDTICYFAPWLAYRDQDIERYWGIKPEIIKDDIPNLMWPTFTGAYFFIKNEQIVRKYKYGTWGLRVINNGFRKMIERFSVRGKDYVFLSENNTANDGCISKNNAAFKAVYLTQWDQGVILLTNLGKGFTTNFNDCCNRRNVSRDFWHRRFGCLI